MNAPTEQLGGKCNRVHLCNKSNFHCFESSLKQTTNSCYRELVLLLKPMMYHANLFTGCCNDESEVYAAVFLRDLMEQSNFSCRSFSAFLQIEIRKRNLIYICAIASVYLIEYTYSTTLFG